MPLIIKDSFKYKESEQKKSKEPEHEKMIE